MTKGYAVQEDPLFFEYDGTASFETSGTNHPTAHCHSPEDLDPGESLLPSVNASEYSLLCAALPVLFTLSTIQRCFVYAVWKEVCRNPALQQHASTYRTVCETLYTSLPQNTVL
jgi:hypothetical protein